MLEHLPLRFTRTLAAVLGLAVVGHAAAQGEAPAEQAEVLASTHHRGTFGGKPIDYEARIERSTISLGAGKPAASLVAISYLAENQTRALDRPVIFVFNGGPINPSAYLHMLAFGPRRMSVPDDLSADPATFKVVDNAFTVLDVADIVFFDTAGTGFCHPTGGTRLDEFFSVENDSMELTRFIVEWCERHGRTASPKYIFGESYGTVRAAVTAKQLESLERPVHVRGLFLMGQALNIVETVQRPGNVMSYVASLPTLAALGWYHGKVDRKGRTFESFLDEARAFARDEYLSALVLGDRLSEDQKGRLARRLEALTGLPAANYLASNLRVTKGAFRATLLADKHLILGADDGRYVAPAGKPGELPDASENILPSVVASFEQYMKNELKLDLTEPYVVASPVKGLEGWRWGGSTPFSDWPYMQSVKEAMAKDPDLKVAVGVGYYDLLTTTGASEYAIAQSGWPRDRVDLHYYQGGHMAYTIEDSLRKLISDVRAFIATP
jgi:carboxypeptidase C (cathepsin A)